MSLKINNFFKIISFSLLIFSISCSIQRTSDIIIVNNCNNTIESLTIDYYNSKSEYKQIKLKNLDSKSEKRLSFNSSDIVIEKICFTVNGEDFEYEEGEIVTYGELLRVEIMNNNKIKVTRTIR